MGVRRGDHKRRTSPRKPTNERIKERTELDT